MNQITKKFHTVQQAKEKLEEIFGAGPYANDGLTVPGVRFTDGVVNIEDKTLTLKSDYWTEVSLEKAFEVGIDNI